MKTSIKGGILAAFVFGLLAVGFSNCSQPNFGSDESSLKMANNGAGYSGMISYAKSLGSATCPLIGGNISHQIDVLFNDGKPASAELVIWDCNPVKPTPLSIGSEVVFATDYSTLTYQAEILSVGGPSFKLNCISTANDLRVEATAANQNGPWLAFVTRAGFPPEPMKSDASSTETLFTMITSPTTTIASLRIPSVISSPGPYSYTLVTTQGAQQSGTLLCNF